MGREIESYNAWCGSCKFKSRRIGSWLGPEWACKVRAWVGLGLLRAWPGGQAQGLACRLSPKTRPAQARAFGSCSKSPSPILHCRLGPRPAPALLLVKMVSRSQISMLNCICLMMKRPFFLSPVDGLRHLWNAIN
jgi:hypothetical protein